MAMMNCNICAEYNVGPEHEISEKHLKNKVFYEYSQHKSQFASNRKGVAITCDVMSSLESVRDYPEGKIKISTQPNEEVKFKFTIKNETNKDEIVLLFVQLAHTKLDFVMNPNGLGFGCTPVPLKPKSTLQKEVFVTFKCADIGQYAMPIIFSFRKPLYSETITIMRDLIVYIEVTKTIHEKIESPYAKKNVHANNLINTTLTKRGDDMFRIPKKYKPIYAHNLKTKEDASDEEKILCDSIRNIFKKGLTQENYIRLFHNLLWYEETIMRINLKNYNMSGVPLMPAGGGYNLVVPSLAEKRPSLMMGDVLFVKPQVTEEEMFEGIVSEIQDNIVLIKGLDKKFDKYYSMTALFDIRFFMSRLPLERMHQAVNCVTDNSVHQRRVFPEPVVHHKKIKPMANYYNPLVESNPEQRLCVEHIVAGSSGAAPYLVHGPPGTGKTVTIVEAILQLVNKDSKNRIMVCTDSNMAADHVATMIIKFAHMFDAENFLLRANSQFRVWETMPECLRKYSNGHDRNNSYRVTLESFMNYRIVITTLSHAAKFSKDAATRHQKPHITHLFIDEAAQASEPACLIPCVGLLTPKGGLILAGDHMQLGPVVISHNARKLGLGLSLMERLKNEVDMYSDENQDPNYIVMLRNNFRSDGDILDLPNERFYKKQLQYLAKEDLISRVDILNKKRPCRAIVFHGVLSKEQKMGKSPSFFNTMELQIVQTYITALIQHHGVKPDDIGVVTPYIRQVYLIKNWLENRFFAGKVEVGTVEAFQGKEKRIIIISTVRANCGLLDHDAKFQLGFLVDDKRFNVALTRAKAKVIIIGNPLCLTKDIKWREYIQRCRDLGSYYGYDYEKYEKEDVKKDIVSKITPIMNELNISKKKKKV